MVRFEKDKFVIIVETRGCPIEDWQNTVDELLEALSFLDSEMTIGRKYYSVLNLLRDMMPDFNDAKKMVC